MQSVTEAVNSSRGSPCVGMNTVKSSRCKVDTAFSGREPHHHPQQASSPHLPPSLPLLPPKGQA